MAADPFGLLGPAPGAAPPGPAALGGDGDDGDAARLLAAAGAAGGAARSAAAACGPRLARPGDRCPACDVPLRVAGLEYECPACHEVSEPADIQDVIPAGGVSTPGAGATRGRLRVVGPDSGWYQADMDRTNPGESSESQKKATYTELLNLNRTFEGRGGRPFPLNVLASVAVSYHAVQRDGVKRSMTKKGILAALLFHICITFGFTRTAADTSEFAGLPTHGIAHGNDYLHTLHERKGLDFDVNASRLRPHVVSVFALLGLEDPAYEPLRAAAADVVQTAIDNYIGIDSVLRSQVFGATAEVLRRRALAPAGGGAAGPRPPDITLAALAGRCSIRVHTLRRFIEVLDGHFSTFAPVFARHGLDVSEG